eukprot:13070841-Alexandrium_andersonii.AAC.1
MSGRSRPTSGPRPHFFKPRPVATMTRHTATPSATNPLRLPRQQLQTRPKHLLPDTPQAPAD